MLVHGKISRSGVFPPEVFDKEERAFYLSEAAKLDITVDEIIESRLY